MEADVNKKMKYTKSLEKETFCDKISTWQVNKVERNISTWQV